MLKILRFIVINLIAFGLFFGTQWWMLGTADDAPELISNMMFVTPKELLPGLNEVSVLPIWGNEPLEIEHNPVVEEGIVYMPISFVEGHFNDDFYWDQEEKVLTYTTINDVIRMKTDDLTYYVNDEPLNLQIPIREMVEGVPFMPLELLKKFSHHEFDYYADPGTLIIEEKSVDRVYVKVSPMEQDYGVVRTWKDRKSPMVEKLAPGEMLKVMGSDTIWMEVRTAEGLTGYIKMSDLGDQITTAGTEPVEEIYDYSTRMTFEGGLNLAWHQVSNTTANKYLDDKLEGVHGLNVISPTWFHIKDAEGHVTNIADLNYVRKAHAQGIQVWALFSNQFDAGLTHEVLSSTAARQNLIKELLALSALYEIDGINVDFENVAKADGEHFVQFMKELTPYLKNQELVVSVDMYVPMPWTAHYGRDEVGEVVDYVMIMAYDEHWSTSPDSGSVASIDFVEKGIINTLKEVPKEKTVLGLPYYTRIWTEEVVDGEVDVSSKAYSMNKAYELMMEEDVTFEWLEDIKQYYAEYEKDDKIYKLWHEEERSIEEKVKLMEQYDLAGVAGWKIGLEKPEIWDVLDEYLK